MSNSHKSDSLVQRGAESEMLRIVSEQLALPEQLRPEKISFGDSDVHIDGYAKIGNKVVLVECYARIGPCKAGNRHKVQSDVLKLAFCASSIRERDRCRVRTIFAFADGAARDSFAKGWRKLASEWAGVELWNVELNQTLRKKITTAQNNQRMVNLAGDD